MLSVVILRQIPDQLVGREQISHLKQIPDSAVVVSTTLAACCLDADTFFDTFANGQRQNQLGYHMEGII